MLFDYTASDFVAVRLGRVLIICAVVSCGRSHKLAPSRHDAAPAKAEPDAAASQPGAGRGEATRTSFDAGQARTTLGMDGKAIARHFGRARRPEAQSTELARGRRAVIAYRNATEPLLLVRDARGRLVWSHERPVGGFVRPVTELALAGGPAGSVVLLLYDAPTQFVAARQWDADGVLLADYEVLRVADCEALSALYWAKHGWIVGCSTPAGARLAELTEAGGLGWNGLSGVALATHWRATAPLSLISDTDASVMAWHVGYLAAHPTAHSADHLFVSRFDARGRPLWTGPLDAGRLPRRLADTRTRIALTRLTPGTVRATVGRRPRFSVVVSSGGRVLRP